MWLALFIGLAASKTCEEAMAGRVLSLADLINGADNDITFVQEILFSGKSANDLGSWSSCVQLDDSDFFLIRNQKSEEETLVGICLPESCTPKEIEDFLNNSDLLKGTLKAASGGYKVEESWEKDISAGTGIAITLIVLLIVLIASGTYMELKNPISVPKTSMETPLVSFTDIQTEEVSVVQSEHIEIEYPRYIQFLLSFSLIHNYNSIFKSPGEGQPTKCLDAVRFFSVAWAIMGSIYYIRLTNVVFNREQLEVFEGRFTTSFGYGAAFATDSLLWVGGFLMAYISLEKLYHNEGRLGWGWGLLKRLLRIWPTYIFVLLFASQIVPTIGQGPLWYNYRERLVEPCGDYWWSNVLFINNFAPDGKGNECLEGTWYLALDLQLFIIGSFLVMTYKVFNKTLVWGIMLGLCIISMIIAWSVAGGEEYAINAQSDNFDDQYYYFFQKPYIRAPAYLLGIISGCVYANKKLKIRDDVLGYLINGFYSSGTVSVVSFIFGVGLVDLFVFVQHAEYSDHNYDSSGGQVFYLGLKFFGFSLGLTLILLPILLGKLRPIRIFLNLKVWTPLARLSFCAFMVSSYFILWFSSLEQLTYYWTTVQLFLDVVFYTFVSYILGLLLYLFIEAPFATITRIIITGRFV